MPDQTLDVSADARTVTLRAGGDQALVDWTQYADVVPGLRVIDARADVGGVHTDR